MFPERIRQIDDRYPGRCILTVPAVPNGVPSEGWMKTLGKEKRIEDVYSKHFHPGALRINPVEIREALGTCTTGSLQSETLWNGDFARLSGQIAAVNALPSYGMGAIPDTAESLNRAEAAISEAYAALSTPDLDLGMMLAEGRETLDMLKKPVSLLVPQLKLVLNPVARFLTAIDNRGRPRLGPGPGARKALDKMTALWLTQRYGIAPLVSDVNNLIKKFNNGFRKDLNVLRRRTGSSHFNKSTVVSVTNEYFSHFYCTWKNTTTYSEAQYCQLYFNESIFRDGIGTDWTDALSLLWETTPYSFVVDWVWDVGSWLRNLQPKPGVRYLGASASHVMKSSLERVCTDACWYLTRKPCAPTTSMYNHTVRKLSRRPTSERPLMPVFNRDCLNLQRSIDSISLIWQNLPGPKPKK